MTKSTMPRAILNYICFPVTLAMGIFMVNCTTNSTTIAVDAMSSDDIPRIPRTDVLFDATSGEQIRRPPAPPLIDDPDYTIQLSSRWSQVGDGLTEEDTSLSISITSPRLMGRL